jgi:hypothetical protein
MFIILGSISKDYDSLDEYFFYRTYMCPYLLAPKRNFGFLPFNFRDYNKYILLGLWSAWDVKF